MKKVLKNIYSDWDFNKYTNEYKSYSETKKLLSNLARAIKNQIQNIRAFDAIDAIFR
jgi:hypothetical protein